MSEVPGLSESIQAVSVIINGTETFLRLSGSALNWSFEKLTKVAAGLFSLYHHKKELKAGEINFSELAKKNNDSVGGLLRIDEDALDDFIEFAKDSGITYSIMPDVNHKDTYKEIAFLDSEAEAIRYFIAENPTRASMYSFEEYIDNSDRDELAELLQKSNAVSETISRLADSPVSARIEGLGVEMMESVDGDTEYCLLAIPNRENEYIRVPYNRVMLKEDKTLDVELDNPEYDVVNRNLVPVADNENIKRVISLKALKERFENIEEANLINSEKAKSKDDVKVIFTDRLGNRKEQIINIKEISEELKKQKDNIKQVADKVIGGRSR